MSKNKRRHFFKTTLITGSAASLLPKKWLKPMISTVIIPAHAQTSPEQVETTSSTTTLSPSVETTAALPTTLAEVCNPDATSPTEFIFTGSSQEFIVPSGITSLDITAIAGEGGGGAAGHGGFPVSQDSRGGTGSMGQTMSQTVSVSPCEAIRIVVGGGGGGGGGVTSDDGIAPGGSGGYKNGNAGNSSSGVADSYWAGGGGGSGGSSIVYRGSDKLVESLGGTGGGGGGYGIIGSDGSDGGAGAPDNLNFGAPGADGGAGYNNSNGTGVGGTRGPQDTNGTVITTSASGSNGADGSITITF